MNPFFSVIIPAYNCESTLSDTLNSVLIQTCKKFEIIIINDKSTDSTLDIAQKYATENDNITIINNKSNIGVAKSRNKGFEHARGQYISLLDSDDLWHKDKLQKQKDMIEKTNCDICCTSYDFIDEKGDTIKSPYIIPSQITYKTLLNENYIGCSTVVIKSSLLNQNSMNPNYYHEDFALWLQLTRQGAQISPILDILMHYRITKTSRSYNKLNAALKRLEIYTKQEKMNPLKAIYYFAKYAVNGVRKSRL